MKTHMALPALDMGATKEFYTQLLGENPVKEKEDYLKFDPDDPALNISFYKVENLNHAKDERHLGFAFQDPERLNQVYTELSKAGLVTGDRDSSVCCYARQDKFHVTDPAGFVWELYTVQEHTDYRIDETTSCCAPAAEESSEEQLVAQTAGGCC